MTRWDRSDDPIPEGHIRRSELFEAYYRKVTPNWGDLEKAIEAAHGRRGSATNAPKRSAWKPAADGPLSKTEEDKFLRTLPKPEEVFLKAEKAFYAATDAKDDARTDAATKFIAALAAGELQPMIQKRRSNQVLSRNMWDGDDVVDLLLGLDGIVDRDGDRLRIRPVFFEAGHAQSWLAKQAAAPIAPKVVGPKGGPPSSMSAIEAELDRWIAGRTGLILERMQRWAPMGGDTRTKGRLALALSNFDGGRTTSNTIQKTLSKKLGDALALII
jgi:hypothetical protein